MYMEIITEVTPICCPSYQVQGQGLGASPGNTPGENYRLGVPQGPGQGLPNSVESKKKGHTGMKAAQVLEKSQGKTYHSGLLLVQGMQEGRAGVQAALRVTGDVLLRVLIGGGEASGGGRGRGEFPQRQAASRASLRLLQGPVLLGIRICTHVRDDDGRDAVSAAGLSQGRLVLLCWGEPLWAEVGVSALWLASPSPLGLHRCGTRPGQTGFFHGAQPNPGAPRLHTHRIPRKADRKSVV